MKTPALVVSALAVALLISAANSQDVGSTRTAQPDQSARKVRELQRERIDVLKEMADQTAALYQRAAASATEMYEAKLQYLKAEAEAAGTDAERIRYYENIVEVLKQYEELAVAAKDSARGTFAAVLKAKAKRLEAEITLEQARGRAPKS